MRRPMRFLTFVAFGLSLILAALGCGHNDDGSGVMRGVMGEEADPGFNGTFRGSVTGTQGGQAFQDTVTVNLTVNSPLTGAFTTVNGVSGTIIGDASGSLATFNAMTTTTDNPPCDGNLSGEITLMDGSIFINAAGDDCDGPFDLKGGLDRLSESICDDQVDNDGDGLIDCDDPDCDCVIHDFLVGQWCAIEIEGAAFPFEFPEQPCDVSTWTFNSDGTYQWFLHALPFFNLDGGGTYSLDGNILTVDGIIANVLFSETPGPQDVISLEIISTVKFRFPDEDGDRWTYMKQ